MAKLKTRTNQPVEDTDGLLNHLSQNGNTTEIDGTLNATKVTGNEIIENMNGYSFSSVTKTNVTLQIIYAGVVKNGNKLTTVIFGKFTRTGEVANNFSSIGFFIIPASVASKLYPTPLGNQQYALSSNSITFFSAPSVGVELNTLVNKDDTHNNRLVSYVYNVNSLTENTEYQFRFETTFLLSDNLVSN